MLTESQEQSQQDATQEIQEEDEEEAAEEEPQPEEFKFVTEEIYQALVQKIITLRKTNFELESQAKDIVEGAEPGKAAMKGLKTDYADITEQLEKLQNAYDTSQDTIHNLEKMLSNSDTKYKLLSTEFSVFKKKTTDKEAGQLNIHQVRQEYQEKIINLDNDKINLTSKYNKVKQQYEGLRKEVAKFEDVRRRKDILEQGSLKAKLQFENAQKEVVQLQKRVNDLTKENEKVKNRIQDIEKEMIMKENELEGIQLQTKKLSQRYDNLREEHHEALKVKKEKDQLEQKVLKINLSWETSKKEAVNLWKRVNDLTKENEKVKNRIQDIEKEMIMKDNEIQNLQSKYKKHQKKYEALRKEVAKFEDVRRSKNIFEQENIKIQFQLQLSQTECQNNQKRINDLTDENSKIKERVYEIKARVKSKLQQKDKEELRLKNDLRQSRDRYEALYKEYEKCKSLDKIEDDYKSQIVTLELQVSNLTKEVGFKKNVISLLISKDFKSKESQFDHLKLEHDRYQKEVMELRLQNGKLQQMCERLKLEKGQLQHILDKRSKQRENQGIITKEIGTLQDLVKRLESKEKSSQKEIQKYQDIINTLEQRLRSSN